MARLKFDLQPIVGGWKTDEENDRWVREVFAQHWPDHEPAPCDCGYRGDRRLVLCRPDERPRCRAQVTKRLESHYRYIHAEGLKKKRQFPGPPHDGKGTGWCRWCGQEVLNPKTGARHKTRTWCASGDCLYAYRLHTELATQQDHLLGRDGLGCRGCGALHGRWAQGTPADPERWRAWGPKHAARYPSEVWVGMFCPVSWTTRLEVDHFIALAVAWEAFKEDARRRWFFSPANLRLVCAACHKAKTNRDRALLRVIAQRGAAWARAEVLRQLADARLIRVARPKGAPMTTTETRAAGENA